MNAKKQAFQDMRNANLKTSVFFYEKVILELTRTDDSTKADFRKFNGKYY